MNHKQLSLTVAALFIILRALRAVTSLCLESAPSRVKVVVADDTPEDSELAIPVKESGKVVSSESVHGRRVFFALMMACTV